MQKEHNPLAGFEPCTTIGVELEFFLPAWRVPLFHIGMIRNHRGWKLIGDVSIEPERFCMGQEAASPILTKANLVEACEVARFAASERIKGKINDSCGLHVHLGVNHFPGHERFAIIRQFALNYLQAQPKDDPRVRQNSIEARSFDAALQRRAELEPGWRESHGKRAMSYEQGLEEIKNSGSLDDLILLVNPPTSSARYVGNNVYGLNLRSVQERGAIEVRQAAGTLDAQEIANWIIHLNNLMALSISQVQEKASHESSQSLWAAYVKTGRGGCATEPAATCPPLCHSANAR